MLALRHQHSGQYEIRRLVHVAELVVGPNASCHGPCGGRVHVTLSQEELGAPGENGVDEIDDVGAGTDLDGFGHQVASGRCVAQRLVDASLGRQPHGQELRVGEPTLGDTLAGVVLGTVELVPLVGHLGRTAVGHAGGQRVWHRLCGFVGDDIPVRTERIVEMTSGSLDVAQVLDGPCGAVLSLRGAPLGHPGYQGWLGVSDRSSEPGHHCEMQLRDQPQGRLIVAGGDPRQGSQRLGRVGVAPQVSSERSKKDDVEVEAVDGASGWVDSRLGVEEPLGLGHAPGVQRNSRSSQE